MGYIQAKYPQHYQRIKRAFVDVVRVWEALFCTIRRQLTSHWQQKDLPGDERSADPFTGSATGDWATDILWDGQNSGSRRPLSAEAEVDAYLAEPITSEDIFEQWGVSRSHQGTEFKD